MSSDRLRWHGNRKVAFIFIYLSLELAGCSGPRPADFAGTWNGNVMAAITCPGADPKSLTYTERLLIDQSTGQVDSFGSDVSVAVETCNSTGEGSYPTSVFSPKIGGQTPNLIGRVSGFTVHLGPDTADTCLLNLIATNEELTVIYTGGSLSLTNDVLDVQLTESVNSCSAVVTGVFTRA